MFNYITLFVFKNTYIVLVQTHEALFLFKHKPLFLFKTNTLFLFEDNTLFLSDTVHCLCSTTRHCSCSKAIHRSCSKQDTVLAQQQDIALVWKQDGVLVQRQCVVLVKQQYIVLVRNQHPVLVQQQCIVLIWKQSNIVLIQQFLLETWLCSKTAFLSWARPRLSWLSWLRDSRLPRAHDHNWSQPLHDSCPWLVPELRNFPRMGSFFAPATCWIPVISDNSYKWIIDKQWHQSTTSQNRFPEGATAEPKTELFKGYGLW